MIDGRDVVLINYEYRYAYLRGWYPVNKKSYCTAAIFETTGMGIATFGVMT